MNEYLTDALHELAGSSPGVDPAVARARGDRLAAATRRRRVAITAVTAVAVIALILGVTRRPDEQKLDVGRAGSGTTVGSTPGSTATPRLTSVTGNPNPPPGVLSGGTGLLILGDDGLGGAVVIDLDHRRVVRRIIQGSAAGDQPHRFDVIDGTIITGWGEIWGVNVRTATSKKIVDGTIYLPGPDGTIWIADWADGRIGAGTFTLERVTIDGRVLQRVVGPKAFPLRGPDGKPNFFPSWGLGSKLLFDSDQGIAAWDPQTDSIAWSANAGGRPGRVLDARAGRALWSADGTAVHVVDERGSDAVLPIVVPPGARIGSVRLSPDATRVAVAIATDQGAQTTTSLRIVDLESGQIDTIGGDLVDQQFGTGPVQWSPDGTQVFSVGWSYASGTTRVARYVLGHDSWTSETLPFGGITASTVVERDGSMAWLEAPDTTPVACTPLRDYSPGRERPPCGFSF